jgi:hypothetical protein
MALTKRRLIWRQPFAKDGFEFGEGHFDRI